MIEIHPLLDPGKQRLARNYETRKRKLSLIRQLSTFCLMLVFILWVSTPLIEVLPQSPALRFLCFIWILTLFTLPSDLVFSYISSYRTEHAFGFSNQDRKQFFTDEAKDVALSLVINPLLALILFLAFRLSPESWWIWAAAAMVLVSGVFATLYPVLILPLFNKYTPVEDEALKERLGRILHDAGLKIKGFYLQDMSRQTKKENAFLGGMGRTRRVVLSDNIIRNMKLDELETVIAHEVGHYKHKHIFRNIFFGALFQLLVFFLTHQVMLRIYPNYLTTFNSMLAAFPLFLLCFGLLNTLIVSPLANALSRYHERQADRYALNATGNAEAFRRSMAGLANRNLSNAYPRPFIKYFYYSHPPAGERLRLAEEWERGHGPA